MTFQWYKILNRAEFIATGLISRELELALEVEGVKTFLVTNANLFSITVDDAMLSIGMNGANPFIFGSCAVYVDTNDDVWYGVAA